MKSYIETQVYAPILVSLLQDLGEHNDVDVSRDIQYCEKRLSAEGMSFLTDVIPTLSTQLEEGLQSGHLEPVEGWKLLKNKAVPAFLSGFWLKIFFGASGSLRSDACPNAIRAVRQVSRFFKKIELPCSEEAVANAYAQYISTDVEIGQLDVHTLPKGLYSQYQRIADCLWTKVLGSVDEAIAENSLLPKHGGGATADRLVGNAKYECDWFEALEAYFPSSAYRVTDLGMNSRSSYEISQEIPVVSVTTVPKVPSKPRIIAIEPTAMQYAQQSVMGSLYSAIDDSRLSGIIGFRDQGRNQELARKGSIDGQLCTIDLSEASDRVHPHFVDMMFRLLPNLREAVFSCRSPLARVPDHGIIELKKFSSMGSALCFPLETMHFLTVVACAMVDSEMLTFDRVIKSLKDVSIFGDDIVVPNTVAHDVIAKLEAVGLKVNQEKSFLQGRFRESCGTDYYAGTLVTPVYVRQPIPQSIQDAEQLLAWVDTVNQLAEHGYTRTVHLVQAYIEYITGPLPVNTGAGLSWIDAADPVSAKTRWNRQLHRLEYQTWVASPKVVEDRLDGYAALTKSLLSLESSPEVRIDVVLSGPTPFGDRGRETKHSINKETVATYAQRVGVREFDHSVKPYTTRLQRRWVV